MFAFSGNGVSELSANMHSISPVRKRHTVVDTESAQHARTHSVPHSTAQILCTVNTALNKSSAAQCNVARDCACSPHAHVCLRRHVRSQVCPPSTPTILPLTTERMSRS